jgi:3-methyladenine DNA glycosylase AlkC
MELRLMFNRDSVGALADAVAAVYPPFASGPFLAAVFAPGWDELALKERMRRITTVLHDFLPADYPEALAILHRTLPRLGIQGFEKMVFPDYVDCYGRENLDTSLDALELFTQEVSAEFAIRPFIERYPQETMARMLAWAGHSHPGVRRLASEGCRPRLPWGMGLPALKRDPSPILPILERLKNDPDEAVRRSVANNLNDIAKDNPDVVLRLLRDWQAGATPEVAWITRHALRTLVKDGDPGALDLLGYGAAAVSVSPVAVTPQEVMMGESVTFSFTITSTASAPQDLVVDYALHLQRAGGKQTAKVFKIGKWTLQPGDTLTITRSHNFRPITTRKYYPGPHAVQPQVNGALYEPATFTLLAAPEG